MEMVVPFWNSPKERSGTMTRITTTIILLMLAASTLYAQTWSPLNEWGISPPPRTYYSAWAESIGDTIQQATGDAERAALARLVQQFHVLYETIGRFEVTRYNSITNEHGILISTTRSRLFLQGVRRETRIRREGSRITVFVLVYLSPGNIEKVRRQIRNEAVAQAVHDFFMLNNTTGMRPFNTAANPEGLHTAWLYSRTVMIQCGGGNQPLYLNQIDAFLSSLSITAFATNYDGRPVRFVYAGQLEIIVGVLQRARVPFSLARPTLTIYAPPHLGNSVAIMGLERVHDRVNRQMVNARGVFSRELTRMVQGESNRSIEFLPLPSSANGLSGAGTILEFVRMGNMSLSRFIIIYYVDSFVEHGDAFGVPPHLFANATLLVYDATLGEIIFTERMRHGIPIFGQQNIVGSADALLRRLLPAHIPRMIGARIETRVSLQPR